MTFAEWVKDSFIDQTCECDDCYTIFTRQAAPDGHLVVCEYHMGLYQEIIKSGVLSAEELMIEYA